MRPDPELGNRMVAMAREIQRKAWDFTANLGEEGDPFLAGIRRARCDAAADLMLSTALALGAMQMDPNSAEAAQEACDRG